MRFVVRFSIGDGYVWSADIVTPVECKSAEQLLVDYEDEVKRAAAAYEFNRQLSIDLENQTHVLRKKKDSGHEIIELWRKEREQRKDPEVHLFGKKWELAYFWSFETDTVFDIEIMTIDEWFQREGFTQTR
jgi:hypothetical protein